MERGNFRGVGIFLFFIPKAGIIGGEYFLLNSEMR